MLIKKVRVGSGFERTTQVHRSPGRADRSFPFNITNRQLSTNESKTLFMFFFYQKTVIKACKQSCKTNLNQLCLNNFDQLIVIPPFVYETGNESRTQNLYDYQALESIKGPYYIHASCDAAGVAPSGSGVLM